MKRAVVFALAALILAGGGLAAWVFATPGGRAWRMDRRSTQELMTRGLQNPADVDLQQALGKRLLIENHPVEAAAAYGTAVAASPDRTDLVLLQVRAMLHAGQSRAAFQVVHQNLKTRVADAFLNTAAGETDLALGNYSTAAARFRSALSIKRTEADARAGLSFALAKGHEHTAALEEARKAIALEPNNSRCLLALGHALLVSGNIREATPQLERCVELDPRQAAAWELLCGILVEAAQATGDFMEAQKRIEQATAAAPRSAVVAYLSGLMYTGQRRYDDAIKSFQNSLAMNPSNPDALYNLSIALGFAGRKEESEDARKRFTGMREYLREATDLQVRLQRDPDRKDLWRRLLRLAEARGDVERAAFCRARLAER